MEKNENKTVGRPPEKTFRAGGISATIWKNQVTTKDGREAEFLSVTFKRSYKDKETDEWKETSSMRAMDLPKAVVVLNKAYEYAVLNGQGDLAPAL
ncbi:hypothetical protein ACFL3V_01470 [Nanoarchaeota archaeon]